MGKILHLIQVSVGDQTLGIPLFLGEPAPEFGNKKADVVVHPVFGSDVPRSGGKAGISGENVRQQGVVQVCGGGQGVKGSLG